MIDGLLQIFKGLVEMTVPFAVMALIAYLWGVLAGRARRGGNNTPDPE
jgi:hypothetical protein